MIDSHAHIHDATYDDDRAAMLERARAAGVSTIVTIGCDLDDSRRALETAQSFGLLASIGIHPHEASGAPADIAAAFDDLQRRGGERVVAIGETGLDYYYHHSPAADQRRVLVEQLAYARDRGLPLVFHQRDAFDDFVGVLREHFDRATMRGVVHCFTGSAAQAATFIDEFGLRLGIGGVVTFKTAEPLRDAIRSVGVESLILETDCPYLAPIPHRGKRNEPAFMTQTLARVAEIMGRDEGEIDAITSRNASALFARPNTLAAER
jgi:TatD DNase family protein